MSPTVPQAVPANRQRSGRQLVAFGFFWLAVLLLVLAGWLAMAQAGRLLHWTKADAEVQRSEVYSRIQRSGGRSSTVWGGTVTIRYLVNGQPTVTTVDRGFQSALRPWMEHWTRHYPAGSRRKILFNPVDPPEADLHGEWNLASFSLPAEFGLAAVLFLWGWWRLRGVAPSS
jgi:hypothetical protein